MVDVDLSWILVKTDFVRSRLSLFVQARSDPEVDDFLAFANREAQLEDLDELLLTANCPQTINYTFHTLAFAG